MYAYRIAYDGRAYRGFQRQPDVATVEGAILKALSSLGVTPDGDRVPPGYNAAGRTDAGVSALAQTVAFDAPPWLTPTAFSGALPDDVHAWARASVPSTFHATHDATRRTYTYHLGIGPHLDEGALRGALSALAGVHDFANLTPDDAGTVRRLEVRAGRTDGFLVVRLSAGGFPRQLVRRVVELARRVAAGELPTGSIGAHLGTRPPADHRRVGPAPPEPLVLSAVTYPGVSFEPDARAVADGRERFLAERARAETAAHVLGAIAPDGSDRG